MKRLLAILVPRLAWLYITLMGRTSSVRWMNRDIEERLAGQGNCIYAFWHGRQFYLAWAYRARGFHPLVSSSQDGGYIADALRLLGTRAIRGSSSRGGARALMELESIVEAGGTVGLTPDGPRGPYRTVAPGILYLAQKTGRPILPITVSCKRKIIFRNWDEYWLPLPFNRFIVNFGEPLRVGETDNLDETAKILADRLNRATDEIDTMFE